MDYFKRVLKRLRQDGIRQSICHYFKLSMRYLSLFGEKLAEKARSKLLRITSCIFKRLPISNAIVFECESDMDDNPRAVYEYLLKQKWNNTHKLIWIVRDVESCKRLYAQKNVVFLNRFEQSFKNKLRLSYYLTTSKWFIFSHPYWFHKVRKEQIIININHGIPLKDRSRSDKNIEDTFDMVLAPSDFSADPVTRFWGCSREKAIICGFPRNDFLFSDSKSSAAGKLFSMKPNDKYIICMPTFKKGNGRIDSNTNDPYSLGVIYTEDDLTKLNDWLEKRDCHIIVKLHPLQMLEELQTVNLSNIHYLNNKVLFEKQVMLYELVGAASGLITDVSSILFDFLLLDRPIGFLMNNVATYSRGFIFEKPGDYMPGEKIWNVNDLQTFVESAIAGEDNYAQERERLNAVFNEKRKTTYSKQFCDILFSL